MSETAPGLSRMSVDSAEKFDLLESFRQAVENEWAARTALKDLARDVGLLADCLRESPELVNRHPERDGFACREGRDSMPVVVSLERLPGLLSRLMECRAKRCDLAAKLHDWGMADYIKLFAMGPFAAGQ